ncbi:MAG: MgtC/SapB family protein [Acidobacteria bacterium]|nr:MgtC/SapB family protein [Acidobacteriota bacterium]
MVVDEIVRLLIAYALAFPIGWDREYHSNSASGIRTFPIVSVACCGMIMVAHDLPGATADSYSRVIQGLMTGIGFVGAGAIMRERGEAETISGTSSAASVLSVSIVGASVGLNAYHIAIPVALLTYITLRYMTKLKK